MKEPRKNPFPRRYPPVYEKLIPIALLVILAVIVVLAVFAVMVLLGIV